MGRVVMNGPPELPNSQWCVACLMDAKQRQWEQFADEIQAGYAASGEKLTVIAWPDALTKELQAGIWRAVCGDFPQAGIVDSLCWTHVAGINPTPVNGTSQLLEGTAGAMPGPFGRRQTRGRLWHPAPTYGSGCVSRDSRSGPAARSPLTSWPPTSRPIPPR